MPPVLPPPASGVDWITIITTVGGQLVILLGMVLQYLLQRSNTNAAAAKIHQRINSLTSAQQCQPPGPSSIKTYDP